MASMQCIGLAKGFYKQIKGCRLAAIVKTTHEFLLSIYVKMQNYGYSTAI